MACYPVKTLIKWPLVKLLQSIKSCKNLHPIWYNQYNNWSQ